MPHLATAMLDIPELSRDDTQRTPAGPTRPDPMLAAWAAYLPAFSIALIGVENGDLRIHSWGPSQVQELFSVRQALLAGSSAVTAGPDGTYLIVHPLRGENGTLAGGLVAQVESDNRDSASRQILDLAPAATAILMAPRLKSTTDETRTRLQWVGEKLRCVTDAVATGVIYLDRTGMVRESNRIAAEILGMPAEEVVGKHFGDFISENDRGLVARRFESRLAGTFNDAPVAIQIVRPCGELRLIQATGSPMTEGDEVVGVVFAARDITDERARETQLRRAERFSSLAPLLGGVCHELNNPLTSIKSFAELMLLDERPEEDVEALEIVRREASRAARIVTDLRLVARQTQEDGSNTDLIDINDVAREAADLVFGECEVSGISVNMKLAPELPEIYGSKPQIERLLRQLITNAVHALAGHDGGRHIDISTLTSAEGVTIKVQDSGRGIPDEDIERIFDPFWTTRTTGEGTGLGLSLAHSIVTDHRGQMHVDGNFGRGAIFTVHLPTSGQDSGIPASHEVGAHQSSRKPLRILIVDDESAIRYSLSRYMGRRGHSVDEAEEGQVALSLVEQNAANPYDIILADLRMPGLNGEQFYQKLKERSDRMEDRLIFITGDAEGPDAADFVRDAGVPVVLKPFELAEIAQIIEALAGIG